MRAEQTVMMEIAKDFIVIKDAGRDGEDRMKSSAVRFLDSRGQSHAFINWSVVLKVVRRLPADSMGQGRLWMGHRRAT